jgi:two-component system, OmpR family, KDP operon response regulator KdpE
MTENEPSPTTDPHLIYIVEDERELREILKEALGHIGHRIRAASDGKQLLELMDQETPDLVLMDIGLPDMSGWELRRILQDDLRHKDVPVIAVTGYGGPALEATALKTLRFADYLRKPYSLVDLMNRIERVFDHEDAQRADEHVAARTAERSR